MSYANREGSLLLGTSNKTELAVGYSTLYGDLCAGLIPIGDLLKTEVYDLARHTTSNESSFPRTSSDGPPVPSYVPNKERKKRCCRFLN